MARLQWDKEGERFFETGVSKGVLYVSDAAGGYGPGVVWNGLTAVNETPSGAEATPWYADNIKYANIQSAEEFGATIEAFTYPVEFEPCDGSAELVPGVTVGQQPRKSFAFCYQTIVGNDLDPEMGKKLHLVYGCKAAPSERAYATVNDTPEGVQFSWELTTTPVEVGEGFKPSAILTIDSRTVSEDSWAALEDLLYGDDAAGVAEMPTPAEVAAVVTV